MSNGAKYIVTQHQRYVDLLLTSAASLKSAMPDLPITIFSQFPIESPHFDNVVSVKPGQHGFYDKTSLMRLLLRARRLHEIIKERGLRKTLAKVFATK